MKKLNPKKISIFFLCIILIGVTLSGCKSEKNYQKEIANIYIRHSSFGTEDTEYKIDIENKEFWQFVGDDMSYEFWRDESDENEGFTFVSQIDEDKIAVFERESARHGFTDWNQSYDNDNVMDGHQWSIVINYADGTTQNVSGSNAYPDTWDDLREDFQDLTGEDVLDVSSDWLL